jgi:hypothetical protein
MMIKEKYLNIHNWISSKDPIKIKSISSTQTYDDSIVNLQKAISTTNYITNSEGKDYILGDKIVTPKDISEYMLDILNKHLEEYTTEDENEGYYDEESYGDYDDSGYYTKDAVGKIVSFFTNLTDDKIIDIATDSVMDGYEIDLDGGRHYFVSHSNLNDMLFNYIFYTKKMSSESFSDSIFNSSEVNEYIEDYYAFQMMDVNLPTDEEFEKLYEWSINKKYNDVCSRYNGLLDNIIKNFNDPILSDLVTKLKDLRADEAYLKSKIRDSKLDEMLK